MPIRKLINKKIFLVIAILLAISASSFPRIIYAAGPGDNAANAAAGLINTEEENEKIAEVNNAVANNNNDSGWWVKSVIQPSIAWLATIFLTLISYITGLAGGLLNIVIYYTVLHMSDGYHRLKGIDVAWKVIRDVGNMGFIFMLLYASIKTIIGQGKATRELIVSMIIAALLINFSLFFTKLVIDASNLLSLTLYSAIAPGAASSSDILSMGLSNSFMNQLHLTSIFQNKGDEIIGVGSIITVGIMGSIMLLITAFVFFAVALLFIIRYVVLIFVLILSPIVFVAGVLPGLNKYRSQWISALTGQALFPPIYFLLTWVTLTVLGEITDANGGVVASTRGALDGSAMTGGTFTSPGFISTFMNFAIIIIFLIISLVVAKSTSEKSGMGIAKLTNKATGYAGAATFGLAGSGLRNTAGRLAAKRAENPDLIMRANSGDRAARLQLAAAKKTANSSFDVRNTSIGGGIASVLDAGRGTDKGFKGIQDDKKKKKRDEARALTEDARKVEAKVDIDNGLAASRELETLRTTIPAGTAPTATQQAQINTHQAAIDKMAQRIQGMSDKEISSMKSSTLSDPRVAAILSGKHLEAIDKSDITEEEKDKIKTAHFKPLNEAVATLQNTAATQAEKDEAKKIVKQASGKELEMLPSEMFDVNSVNTVTQEKARTFIGALSQSQIDELTKSQKLLGPQRDAIKDERARPLKDALEINPATNLAANPTEALNIMKNMDNSSLAKLDESQLTNPSILELYTPQRLAKLTAHISDAKADAIRREIIAAATNPGITAGPNVTASANWLISPAGNIF